MREVDSSPYAVQQEDVSADGKDHPGKFKRNGWGRRFNVWFNARFTNFLDGYERILGVALVRPLLTVVVLLGLFVASLALYPWVGLAYFPRTDPGQFVINIKTVTGTRLEDTEAEVKKLEDLVRREVAPHDLRLIVSNIGTTPGFSAMYTSNSASHTAFVQVSLTDDHKVGSYEYMDRVRAAVHREMPEISSYFQSGGLVDAVLNLGLPAPIDVQVSGSNLENDYAVAQQIAQKAQHLSGVSDVLIPQDIDAPSFQLNINRIRASELGLSQREVVSNIITALTSNVMIAPSYWVDPKTGNDYFLSVQYPEGMVKSVSDLSGIPLRGLNQADPTRLDMVADVSKVLAPTEVDHYQLRRVIDAFVATKTENLAIVAPAIQKIVDQVAKPAGVRVKLMGTVQAMYASFSSFGYGLLLSVLLVYLVLVAQFRSFIDPFLILLAVPPGLMGVILTLVASGTTLNVMSLMGVVMMVGVVVSNIILIVEFTHRLIEDEGMPVREAVAHACRIRLRPILMTSLATIFGLIPMALKFGTGSEAYAPLAKAIIGGLSVSVVLTVFLVPAAFLIVYRRRGEKGPRARSAQRAENAANRDLRRTGACLVKIPRLWSLVASTLALASHCHGQTAASDPQPNGLRFTLVEAEALRAAKSSAGASAQLTADAVRPANQGSTLRVLPPDLRRINFRLCSLRQGIEFRDAVGRARRAEQPNGLLPAIGRRDAESTHHRFRPHLRPDRKRQVPRQRGE